ncbi:MAG: undecaprenyl-diphosphate phosphatase, partial [Rhodocyclaceae bacterium]|nr:undecaprenyl-diphosphate phosphatase [Rhodocyclaceae bacterium]
MDISLIIKAFIMGIVEGLTEFLPVSSTGHLILAGELLNFNNERAKLFEIVIQSGAILAVVWEYRAKIGQVLAGLGSKPEAQRFVLNVVIAFLPLALLGLVFGEAIKTHLFNAATVATTFVLGGIFILWAEKRRHRIRCHEVDDVRPRDALLLGLCQAL